MSVFVAAAIENETKTLWILEPEMTNPKPHGKLPFTPDVVLCTATWKEQSEIYKRTNTLPAVVVFSENSKPRAANLDSYHFQINQTGVITAQERVKALRRAVDNASIKILSAGNQSLLLVHQL